MLIDLSVELNEQTPVYPGDPATKITPAGTHEGAGFQDHVVCMGTHVGTHIDAPSHMVKGGKNLNQFPIDTFSGRGVYVGAHEGFDIKNANIKEGDIVLFHTGMSEQYQSPTYFETYPAIPEDVARLLVSKKVKMIGVDTCSVDYPPFPVHKILLENEVLIIENLTNLGALAGKEFRVHAFPIKLQIDGAPVRVVAEVY